MKDFDISSQGSFAGGSHRGSNIGRNVVPPLLLTTSRNNHNNTTCLPKIIEPLTNNKNRGPDLYLPHLKPKATGNHSPRINFDLAQASRRSAESAHSARSEGGKKAVTGSLMGNYSPRRNTGLGATLMTPVLQANVQPRRDNRY